MEKAEKESKIIFEKSKEEIDISEEEKKRILECIQRTDNEKFYLFTRLMRIHFMLKNATILK